MTTLIAFECSGRVRHAFLTRGYNAVSMDIKPTEVPGPHIVGDVYDHLHDGWDAIIAFPPCTYLANSGNRWYSNTPQRQASLASMLLLASAQTSFLAIENPIGAVNSHIRKPDQVVQPYWFGDGYTKATCLWLKGLPPLKPTRWVMPTAFSYVLDVPKSERRSVDRSRTPMGLASAMGNQWGPCIYGTSHILRDPAYTDHDMGNGPGKER